MKVVTQFDQTLSKPTAVALGNFDGLHLGHQRVISTILDTAAVSTVVSFDPHPQEFFSQIPRFQLTPLPEKQILLERLGVQQLVILPFTESLAELSYSEFIERILQNYLQAEHIAVGFNFRFGKNRQGTIYDLKRVWGDRLSIISEQCLSDAVRISSSNIRNALERGDLELAKRMLGRPYSLTGKVIYGQQLGRQLGFPTANLLLPERKFLPRHGVYAVQVDCIHGVNLVGVMNIGVRPTVENGCTREVYRPVVEVHIMDWEGNLYGSEMRVQLISFLRPEHKFHSLEELKQQIAKDCSSAKRMRSLI